MPGNQNSGGPRNVAPTAPNAPKTQPVRVPTGQQYGAATQQAQAQRSVPLPQGQSVPSSAPPAASLAPVTALIPPNPFTTGTTHRPDEPLTAGMPFGPGAGPEVLAHNSSPNAPIADIIATLAASSGSTELSYLADQAKALNQ